MIITARGGELPLRVEEGDLRMLETTTRAFRALDYRCGGGVCRAPLAALGSWTMVLRKGSVPPRLRRRLCRDLADLHNLRAWTEFDSGHDESALRSFDVAAELATEAGDHDLLADIRYRRGRLRLQNGAVDEALAEFEQGQVAARRGRSALAQAILSRPTRRGPGPCGRTSPPRCGTWAGRPTRSRPARQRLRGRCSSTRTTSPR
ncbi:hypothetical protein [Amycolatopsis sp. DG1A-15b]|uniref:hypothetical protein n=1 Tax=Amycolatopsis sp. DG1A-15b TaxID=3052846 RepID=UPI00255BD3B1|nr:hypothetical protein [Amycolatopsis sp. DG1A-15b]WIX85209.1 hypothetical protein QRY02_28700 [Amycolatopsis sp. DG1A-15b]